MKKLTEKDAIWCKTQKQAKMVKEKLNLEIDLDTINVGFRDYGQIVLYADGNGFSSYEYAVKQKFTIHKAKDILKKSFKKDVLNRLDKLEKVISDNTSVNFYQTQKVSLEPLKFDLPKKELEELPEKWCVKMDRKEVIDYANEFGERPPYTIQENLYAQFPSLDRCTSVSYITEGYTEITFDQFKKWVLKEEEKPLSIREVQVKVSNQEEANECAEIAKACGEKISKLGTALLILDEDEYFRKNKPNDNFGVFDFDEDFKEISLQEFRERFGKKQETEIDWSKAGQLVVQQDGVVVITSGIHCEERNTFAGISPTKRRGYSDDWNKSAFKLCTEPITLKNE